MTSVGSSLWGLCVLIGCSCDVTFVNTIHTSIDGKLNVHVHLYANYSLGRGLDTIPGPN